MRNRTWFVISSLAAGTAAACAVDDSVVPMTTGAAGSAATTGAAGKGSGGAPTTTAAGGKGGASGASGVVGTGGKAGGGVSGGAAGTSVGGGAGTTGAGGTTIAGTGGAPEAGMPDAPDTVADAGPEVEPCVPESDVALCARVHKNCGSFLGVDNCGASRAVLACGRCVDDGAVCGSAGTLNLCPGTQPVNRAQGGTVLSTNPTSPPMFAAEGDLKVFDNDIRTKWYVRGNATPSIAYDFGASRMFAITSYTITSANDAPEHDPVSWRLEGSNSQNLSTWTTLDTRTNETFASRGQTNFYSFVNPNGYVVTGWPVDREQRRYAQRGRVSGGRGIQLFGDPAGPADAGAEAATTDATSTDARDGGTQGAASDSSLE